LTSVNAGEFVASQVIPARRTTLLNLTGLLEEFEAGSYRLDGENVKAPDNQRSHPQSKIGFVFQGFNLIPT
jgi:putative ABC transport system ATP-binding protein